MIWFLKLLAKLAVAFVALSLFLVVLFKFVPVPVTATMLLDGNGITKDWEPLSDIDRDLVRAAIAAEDGKFCTHEGFDAEAIQNAIQPMPAVGASAAAPRSASRPRRTSSCGRAAAISAKGWRRGSLS